MKPRFIAGAECPQCRELDSLTVELTAEGNKRVHCVLCDYEELLGPQSQHREDDATIFKVKL